MKKCIALFMATLMLFSLVACAQPETSEDPQQPTNTAQTVGETLLADFRSNCTGSAQEIADHLLANPIITFMGGAMPVEEGLLSGFDNAEITGFQDGVMFAPMTSSIAFVGYIFELADGADVSAFKTMLKDSANLRWNICVEAEELIVDNEGNMVFFLMCPKSFEQPETEDGAAVLDDMIITEEGITLE